MATKPAPTRLTAWYFQFRPDRDQFRVWRTDWTGDQFEVLSQVEFEALRLTCARFSILLLEADED